MANVKNMTSGKPMSLIIAYFLPVLCSTLFQQLYSIVDTIIVGKGIGDHAVGAVGSTGSITFFIFGFIMGLGCGMSVLISQAFGANDGAKLRKAFTMGIIACGAVALLIMVVSLLNIRQLLQVMDTPEKIMDDALLYIVIIILGIPLTLMYDCFGATLNALGNSRTPFIAVIISTIINIILDIVFIVAFGMGVEGAAIATLIAQFFSAIFCYGKMRQIEVLRLSKEDWKLDFKVIWNEVLIGVPLAFMNSITAIGCILQQFFVNGLGLAYTSSYAGCSRITQFIMQPISAVGMTMSTYAGQNLGAGKIRRIKEGLFSGFKLSMTITVIGTILLVLTPKMLAGIVLSDSHIIDISKDYLQICGVMLWSISMLFLTRSTCQGMGNTFIPMLSGILELLARVIVMKETVHTLGYASIAVAEVTAWFSALVLNAVYLFYKLRKLSKQDREIAEA